MVDRIVFDLTFGRMQRFELSPSGRSRRRTFPGFNVVAVVVKDDGAFIERADGRRDRVTGTLSGAFASEQLDYRDLASEHHDTIRKLLSAPGELRLQLGGASS